MLGKRKRALMIAVAALLITGMACNVFSVIQPQPEQGSGEPIEQGVSTTAPGGGEGQAEAPTEGGSSGGPASGADLGIMDQIDRGQVELAGVQATEEEISGPILLLQVTNPTDEEVVVTIPCGLIFEPADEDEQRMMVIQHEEISLPPGGEGTLEPYVICIDADRAGPSIGSGYSLGVLADADLLKLAQCVCNEDLTALEEAMQYDSLMGLQMAVWLTSSGESDLTSMFESISQAESNALGGLPGETGDQIEGLQDALSTIVSLMGGSAEEWLAKCDLQQEP